MNRRKFLINTSVFLSFIGLGALYWPHRWKYIVVHHSAGNFGNIDFLQRVHRERTNDPIHAIAYHYVIGNGNGLADGKIDSDFRKKYNLWGSHVSIKNIDRNVRGIGICLVGNFEEKFVTDKQYKSLVSLTMGLMKKYSIPSENVTGHGLTPGESTKCPGKNFPMSKFLADIA